MKGNRWLIAAVIVLTIGLAVESVYLIKLKNERPADKGTAYPVALQGASPSGYWNRPVFSAGFHAWDPFEEMDQIQNVMNRMFRDSFNRGPRGSGLIRREMSYEPDLDVQEAGDAYLIRLDLPGVEKDKISVKVQNNMLVISGERKSEKEETSQSGGFYRMESSFGSFMRSFPLPSDADPDNMTAESKNGVLTIRLPKLKDVPSSIKNIQVQ